MEARVAFLFLKVRTIGEPKDPPTVRFDFAASIASSNVAKCITLKPFLKHSTNCRSSKLQTVASDSIWLRVNEYTSRRLPNQLRRCCNDREGFLNTSYRRCLVICHAVFQEICKQKHSPHVDRELQKWNKHRRCLKKWCQSGFTSDCISHDRILNGISSQRLR